jgi:hypothetical protein
LRVVLVVAGLLGLCATALAFPAAGYATTAVSTVGEWNGSESECCFGDPNTATYGQVVNVPAGQDSLDSFTFYLKVAPGLVFRPYVYAWNGNQATGPALYEGPEMHTPSESGFEPITVNTGGVAVTAGQEYVLFFSISNDKAADEGTGLFGSWGALFSSSYGKGVWFNNEYNAAAWATEPWDNPGFAGFSMAFTAVFREAAAEKHAEEEAIAKKRAEEAAAAKQAEEAAAKKQAAEAAAKKQAAEEAAAKKHAEEELKRKQEEEASSPSVKITKVKVTRSGIVVAITMSRAGTITITGPGLKKATKTLAAGEHQITVRFTKAGRTLRAHGKKIKITIGLKAGAKTVSGSKVVRL